LQRHEFPLRENAVNKESKRLTEHDLIISMKTTPLLIGVQQGFVLCSLLFLLPNARAAQFVEVSATITVITWPGEMLETRRTYTTHCVVGQDTWFFEGGLHNAITENWWTGSNVVQRTAETKPSAIVAPGDRRPGTSFGRTVVHRSPDGLPARASGFDNVPWLAFCSGEFLKRDGRRVPLPIDVLSWRLVPDYSDTTVVFDDTLGLPQKMELHTPDRQLVCQYEVQQSTNFLGWNFPLHFKIAQSRLGYDGKLIRHGQATGKVFSMRVGTEPRIPVDVLTNLLFSTLPDTNPFPAQWRVKIR
jgi:hypothetical protein